MPQTGNVAERVKKLRCVRSKVKLCKLLCIVLKEKETEISAVSLGPFDNLMGKSATT